MSLNDLASVVAITLAISLATGVVGVGVLLLLRRTPLYVQLATALSVGVVSVVASMIAVANLMYLSPHDLVVAIAVAVAAGVSSLVVAVTLCMWVVANMRALSRAAERIGKGELVVASTRAGSAEFARVEGALAHTSEQLRLSREREARVEASRRELVAWISHDLRTPLAGIRAMAEALEDDMVDDPGRYHRQMRAQVDLLSSMVDDLFDLSRIDAGALRLRFEEVSLLDVVSDAVADVRPAAPAREISVDSTLPRGLSVHVDPGELSRAIGNLLMNAVQHTPSDTPIAVRVEMIDDRPTVSVLDRGPGIDPDDLPRLFEPGWRGSTARTPYAGAGTSPGAGLGLAIVRGIVSAHNGEVVATNISGGCRFDIRLPAVSSSQPA
ncbi:sensor histidine kinase [Microbacterium xanthum]|uniref:sensor histidine kinase n=1 Tax=Microbacterium xanthum TaxID=3079794 RepID=UPI002AD5153C|nr:MULTISPECIES: HAMP domain-containing sensor histidine kinase [unclassified Microbacterium]MDZ8172844.1 HAMP domain-containing sensor histidine kinase [Microbacterium sp. KSW-48]MDZ8202318.1 HAMP domain-containing sensor histidine kinase [Microbacterium sp. SSW1-59]